MMDRLFLEVPALMSRWGLTAFRWEKIKDVFRVETDNGTKNLKISPFNPERLAFVHGAVQHLILRGFTRMVPLIPTLSGDTYVSSHGYAFSLFDWIEGRQADFSYPEELKESTRALAEFHQCSAGFTPPPGSNMRDLLGKCLRHFEERYQNLVDFKKQARHIQHDEFARLYLENVDFFLPMAETAIVKLKASNYTQLVQQAKFNQTFCHGDPAARNFILTPQGNIFMIDFDSTRLDLPIMDLIKFTRRVMKKHDWNFETARLIIDAYQEVIPLSPEELDVMRATFYFPQKFWRMSIRHFHRHNHYSPEREVLKFQKLLEKQQNMADFQVQFDHYFDSTRYPN
ncbi:MAG TPA: CotS family spore coat protein [Bacillota bacterium]|nr:CotS family spore coat protein [Bacillota bacterium]HPT87184.1 CotS family spore coat protein [Bacillota bacterium]